MFSVGSDFSRGIGYVFKGIMGFWKRPRLWVYAIVPFICVKVVLALVAAVVWVLLPIDLVPDSLPFLGMLDDVTVAIFSGIVLKNSVEGHVQRRQ